MTITSPRRSSRRLTLVLALAAIAGTALFSAATANAGVVTGRPSHTYVGSECSVTLGSVAMTPAVAEDGVDVACNHYHSYITAKVDLYRWNGSAWKDVSTSGWQTTYNNYHLSAHSGYYCGGGATYWDEIATVNIDGSQQTYDLWNALPSPQTSLYFPPATC